MGVLRILLTWCVWRYRAWRYPIPGISSATGLASDVSKNRIVPASSTHRLPSVFFPPLGVPGKTAFSLDDLVRQADTPGGAHMADLLDALCRIGWDLGGRPWRVPTRESLRGFVNFAKARHEVVDAMLSVNLTSPAAGAFHLYYKLSADGQMTWAYAVPTETLMSPREWSATLGKLQRGSNKPL